MRFPDRSWSLFVVVVVVKIVLYAMLLIVVDLLPSHRSNGLKNETMTDIY